MSFELLRSIIRMPALRAKPEAVRVDRDSRSGGDAKERRQPRAPHEDDLPPASGKDGPTIGKVIDTTA